MPQCAFPRSVDVLVVGGGPTGLLIGYVLILLKLNVLVIEKLEKAQQSMYGRSSVLHAGTLELLDVLGIYDRIADTGFVVRGATTFKDGIASTSRGWSFINKTIADNAPFDFNLTLRQKYVEEAIRSAISDMDPGAVRVPAKLVAYRTEESSEYPIIATVEYQGESHEVRCKYLIGADGGRSTVRKLGGLPFPGASSPYIWVRVDAIIKTDMPSSRSTFVALESPEFGNVLWTPVDNGRTRIGFVCPEEIHREDRKGATDKAIMEAARNAVKPFSLEFIKIDWWTIYGIGHRVAEKYKEGHVILAGDAAHTHSSGSAQGVNVGVHDVVNLGWKLAGVITSVYEESVLDTYSEERRAAAQRLIQLDKDISTLISGKIPTHFNAPPDADFNEYLDMVNNNNAAFTVGTGISYSANLLNRVDGGPTLAVKIGHRAPNVPLYRPGINFPKLLRTITAYVGRFWILVFAGRLERTTEAAQLNSHCATKYLALREYMDSPCSFTRSLAPVFEFLTILLGKGSLQPAETLGAQPLGKTLYDHSGEAYEKYGISPDNGAIVVMRPDGIICFSSELNGGDELARYFSTFVRCRSSGVAKGEDTTEQTVVREISIEGREESTQIS